MLKSFLSLLLALGFLSACTHSVHQSYTGDFLPYKQKGARFITVEAKRNVFLDFLFETNYVEEARNKLLKACSNEITGVNVQHITSHGFASYTEKVRIKALCLD